MACGILTDYHVDTYRYLFYLASDNAQFKENRLNNYEDIIFPNLAVHTVVLVCSVYEMLIPIYLMGYLQHNTF